MNVIQVIKPKLEPVKLIRSTPGPVQLVRIEQPVRLVNTKGVVNFGNAGQADTITIKTKLASYYNLQKQV